MFGIGKKVEKVAAEHFLNTLVTNLQKDGHSKIPGVGEAYLQDDQEQLVVNLDVYFQQRLKRTGQI